MHAWAHRRCTDGLCCAALCLSWQRADLARHVIVLQPSGGQVLLGRLHLHLLHGELVKEQQLLLLLRQRCSGGGGVSLACLPACRHLYCSSCGRSEHHSPAAACRDQQL